MMKLVKYELDGGEDATTEVATAELLHNHSLLPVNEQEAQG
jgi:hypothetical protein